MPINSFRIEMLIGVVQRLIDGESLTGHLLIIFPQNFNEISRILPFHARYLFIDGFTDRLKPVEIIF